LAQHLKQVAIDHSNGIFVGKNDIVEKLTGRKPQTIKEFILKNKACSQCHRARMRRLELPTNAIIEDSPRVVCLQFKG
jgi:hypothetical protein